jgi:cytochrome P450
MTAGSQEVTTFRARFPKPVELYETLTMFGANIVATEGEEWKKYRKIAAPAFSEVCIVVNPSPRS